MNAVGMTFPGPCMGPAWIMHGYHMNYKWVMHGLLHDLFTACVLMMHETAYGLYMDMHGLCVDCEGVIHKFYMNYVCSPNRFICMGSGGFS